MREPLKAQVSIISANASGITYTVESGTFEVLAIKSVFGFSIRYSGSKFRKAGSSPAASLICCETKGPLFFQ